MNEDLFATTFNFRMMFQADWRTPERSDLLISLTLSSVFGDFYFFSVNEGEIIDCQEMVASRLIEQARNGNLEFLDLKGDRPVPTGVSLMWDRMRYRPQHDFPVGKHMLSVFWSRKASPIPGEALRAWSEILERHAGPLALRYGDIRCPEYSMDKGEQAKRWISPQYAIYAARVMLFGPREIERFGRDYLLAAPAHEVKLLDCGSVLIIASPHSLDPSAPEDEEALARLNDYLLAHPKAGVLM